VSGPSSFVVTGASGGVGGAIATHLASLGHVVVNLDPAAPDHRIDRVHHRQGSAADSAAALAAAELAESLAPLAGWVNNASVSGMPDSPRRPPARWRLSSPRT